jgi:hypothetical protein
LILLFLRNIDTIEVGTLSHGTKRNITSLRGPIRGYIRRVKKEVPDPSSGGAPDFYKTKTLKQYIKSGHEPQMELDTKTDSPTDHRS